MNAKDKIKVIFASSAPGRADFLNTHQDYKGLPVVPVALDLRTYVIASKTDSPGTIEVLSLNLKERGEAYEDRFNIGEKLTYVKGGFFGNYFRAVAKVALAPKRRQAKKPKERKFGLRVVIKSEVPVSAGLASSAALEVSFATLLNDVYELGLDRRGLAEVGYKAENVELGIPCGRLDQYGSSIGGVILVECKPPYNVKRIPFKDLCFVVIDSGIRHSTAEIHPFRQGELNRGLKALLEDESITETLRKKLSPRYDEARWSELSEVELEPHLSKLDGTAERRILFTIRMQKSTELALDVMNRKIGMKKTLSKVQRIKGLSAFLPQRKANDLNSRSRILQLLGSIMNYQHCLLRDLYDVSLPEIEKIKEAILGTRAYGVKISGAGLGGSLIALVDNKEDGQVTLGAGLNAGAKQGWISGVGAGAKIENIKEKQIQSILRTNLL